MTGSDVRRPIEASAMERARAVVARSKQIAAEDVPPCDMTPADHATVWEDWRDDCPSCGYTGRLSDVTTDPDTLTPEQLVTAELTDDEDVAGFPRWAGTDPQEF